MKRNIIRLMTLCTVAVLALASCKKDNQPQNNAPENGFLATIEANQGNGDSRTHLVGSEVQWNAGDQIVVRNGNGTSATFSLSAGENTMNGTFLSSQSGDDFFQPSYTAIYPAAEGNSITGEGTATITLPATQSYVANSFANGAMPMMAVSSDQTLAFKNMLGGICFPMIGLNMTVTRFVLTSNSADDNLSGVFAANYNNGQPTLTCTTGSGNSITLDCGEGVALDVETATDFTIMVPAGSLANGFKLEAYNGEEKVFEKTNDATLGADFISRSVIRKVNTALLTTTIDINYNPVNITTNSAECHQIIVYGSSIPSEYGVLYAKASCIGSGEVAEVLTYENADGTDVIYVSGSNEEIYPSFAMMYDANMTGLEVNTVYYVRACVKIGTDYQYTDCVPFATRRNYFADDGNQGLMRRRTADGDTDNNLYEYTVSANQKVYFSVGNLQYNAVLGTHAVATGGNETGTWRLAESQYHFVGRSGMGFVYEGGVQCSNENIAQGYSGWIDLFGWGTSGWNSGAVAYQPYSSSKNNSDYKVGGEFTNNLTGDYANADWGVYNAISNGGNAPGMWRILTGGPDGEFEYLLNNTASPRNTYRYARVTFRRFDTGDDYRNVIVFPDNFSWPTNYVNVLNDLNINSNQDITEAQWSLLEQQGAIMLPGGGSRNTRYNSNVPLVVVGGGSYRTSTYNYQGQGYANSSVYALSFGYLDFNSQILVERHLGHSVRLVRPAN